MKTKHPLLSLFLLMVFIHFLSCATHPKEDSSTRFNVNDNSETEINQSNTNTTEVSLGSDDTLGAVFSADAVSLSSEEEKMYKLIMAYRVENNLSEIPLSKSLTFVAQQHCKDLYHNRPDKPKECNAHSWSANGAWTACCYTSDHKQANGMWKKPSELTQYTGNGYEIACGSSKVNADYDMTAEYAVDSWKGSTGHNNVILNKDGWDGFPWGAIGVGIYKGFACVWFGQQEDPAGVITIK
ncbi:MAG: CAP domain-containing protein [Crocinitomicaceae bacterium]|nr:CAP domain-containing protein [Crocinitomicaceae bacterium]MBK8926036.1 CAP domain-containing protein [Crocinitomicaceae bacterium]